MAMEFLNEIIGSAVILIASGISAYVLKYFKDKKKSIQENKNEIEELSDKVDDLERKCSSESTRLRKAVIILAKRLDSKSKAMHPKGPETAFEEITRDILTDEY